jgi:hypothetical protein
MAARTGSKLGPAIWPSLTTSVPADGYESRELTSMHNCDAPSVELFTSYAPLGRCARLVGCLLGCLTQDSVHA